MTSPQHLEPTEAQQRLAQMRRRNRWTAAILVAFITILVIFSSLPLIQRVP